ncbi:PREDICTED: ropporin-1-like protein [Vollenhovia emeryi]|uniref:ropporin-1-like protein n=1 Tax=Vollenhovia emeryi TaxID=411798 RepID=UPI0005F5309C|nr:PREDICTED: ropporin-1-like protein [Vollenhovia emeryi]
MSDSQTKRIYCAQQINVPPTLPHILKLYAKAAIRTQPHDLLRWTAAYFRALANGEVPPAKDRLEYPPFMHPSGITPGYLRTLLDRFARVNKVRLKDLLQDWRGLDLPETSLYQLFMVAGLLRDKEYCDFYRFLAVACGFLGNNLLETMTYVCELLTREPEGGSAMIPLRIFLDLYGYLADLDCGRHRRKAEERTDFPHDATTSVSEPSSGTIDLTTRARSCEFAAMEKVSGSRRVSLPVE